MFGIIKHHLRNNALAYGLMTFSSSLFVWMETVANDVSQRFGLGSVELTQLQQSTWFTPVMWLVGTLVLSVLLRFVSKLLKLVFVLLILGFGFYYLKTYTTYLGIFGM